MSIQNLKFYSVHALCFAIVVIAAIVQFNTYLAPDLGWHLIIAKGMLAGKSLYVDFFEVNTPLIIYIAEISTLISQLLSISLVLGLNIFNFALALASLLLCYDIIKREGRDVIILFFIAFALFILPLSYPISEFGQKEHVFMMLFIPYLLEFALQAKPRAHIFVLACIGMLIKPFFLLGYLGILAVRIMERDKVITREILILGITNTAFYLWMWVAHRPYFDTIIPIALDGYKTLNLSDGSLKGDLSNFYLISLYTLNFLVLPLMLSLCILTKNSARLVPIMLALLAAVYIQAKDFWYHYIPFMITIILLFGLLVVECVNSKRFVQVVNSVLIVGGLVNVASLLDSNYQNQSNLIKHKYFSIIESVKEYRGQNIMNLSSDLAYIIPEALYSNLVLNMKEHTLQILDGIFKHPQQVDSKKKSLDYVVRDVIGALESKPKAVFVLKPSDEVIKSKWTYAFFFKAGYNYIDFFSQYPKFKELWKSYEFKKEVGNAVNRFEIYELKEGL